MAGGRYLVPEASREVVSVKFLFLAAFGSGLAIAVYAMLHGVERTQGSESLRPAPHLNLPALAAFLVSSGAVGYLLLRNTILSNVAISLIAIAGGVGGWIGMTIVMAKWALRPAQPSAHDEAEEFQGHPAIVVSAIHGEADGSIRYHRNGTEHVVSARHLTDRPLPSGTEVVIDRFEGGVAIVEDWASVEQRL